MLGKFLLGCVVLSGGLIIGNQVQVRQSVFAETKESISYQQEMASSVSYEDSSTTFSTEEIRSSETTPSTPSTTVSTEPEKTMEELEEEPTEISSIPESSVLEKATPIQTPVPAAKVEENYQFSVVKNQTTEEFIQTIGADAQKIAWDEGLYASVMIAQAILETGSGNSQLARPPHHNLFGIKGSYQGKNVSINTQEDKGNGQLYTIKSAFRQYPSYKESLEDYAVLLKKGISGNSDFYQATWKENAATYQAATKALTGKYATDTSYDKKLNALIETYQLTAYDAEPNTEETISSLKGIETPSESMEISAEQTEDKMTKLNTTEEPKILMSETKQSVVILPPITQRPAKEIAGNRIAQ